MDSEEDALIYLILACLLLSALILKAFGIDIDLNKPSDHEKSLNDD